MSEWLQALQFILAFAGLCVTAYLAYRTEVIKRDVAKIEKATNSMKDALVRATGDAAFAAGKEAQKKEG